MIGKIKNAQQVVAAGHGEKSVKISQHAFLSGHYSKRESFHKYKGILFPLQHLFAFS